MAVALDDPNRGNIFSQDEISLLQKVFSD